MHRLFLAAILLFVLSGCRLTNLPERGRLPKRIESTPPATNLTAECVADFNSDVDYFPDKAKVEFATQFEITYHRHFKRVTFKPNTGRDEREEYLLVQCGTPVPQHNSKTRVIAIPAQRFVLAHLAFISSAVRMNLTESLIGISSIMGVSQPEVIERYKQGQVKEVGVGPHSSVEIAIAADADLIFTFYSAWPNYNTHPKLWELGVPTVPLADHFEQEPLGRTEWIKFLSAFFNREREANEIFEPAARRYVALRESTRKVSTRPQVLVGWTSGRDIWNLNGGRNFFARLIWDAGGQYFWQDELSLSQVPISFERIFDQQRDTTRWISPSFAPKTKAALAQQKPALSHLAAFEQDGIWSPDKNTQIHRRAPWQDQSLDKPDEVLADMISILHPELMRNHEPFFIRKLD